MVVAGGTENVADADAGYGYGYGTTGIFFEGMLVFTGQPYSK
jgi:hypothetical protein